MKQEFKDVVGDALYQIEEGQDLKRTLDCRSREIT